MKTQLVTAFAVTLLALGLTACGDRTLAPGTYESERSSVDSQGTRTEKSSKTDVYIDAEGDKRVVKKTTTTKDPKGLLNKSTTSSTTEKEYRNY